MRRLFSGSKLHGRCSDEVFEGFGQIIATSHDLGPQKVAEDGKSPYLRNAYVGEIFWFGQRHSLDLLQKIIGGHWHPWKLWKAFFRWSVAKILSPGETTIGMEKIRAGNPWKTGSQRWSLWVDRNDSMMITNVTHQNCSLTGGFKYCLFSPPTWGNDPIWLRFFQMGWNHQPVQLLAFRT